MRSFLIRSLATASRHPVPARRSRSARPPPLERLEERRYQPVSALNRGSAPGVAHRMLLRASLDITGRPARKTVTSNPVHDRKPGWTVTALR
jgi:hypothetical protein